MICSRVLTCIGAITIAATAFAQGATYDPPTVIEHATVITKPGAQIDDATLILENGRITSVGSRVKVPEGARVLDGTGMYVYPAFIDGASHMGMPEGPPNADERKRLGDNEDDPRQGPRTSMQRANRKGFWPHWHAADTYKPNQGKREGYRKAGFGTALVLPNPAILTGAGDVLDLSDEAQRNVTLARRVAHIGSLGYYSADGYARNSYPASAMGTTALYRQTFSDADWQHTKDAPVIADPVLDEVDAIRKEDRPIFFTANTAGEIHHVLDRADELGITPVILGGAEAWRVADRLARANVPVVAELDWDDKPKRAPKKEDEKESTPKWDDTISWSPEFESDFYEPLRVRDARIADWEDRVNNVKALRAAGVHVAITTRDLDNPTDVHKKIREMIGLGLSENDALALLTTSAADLLGISSEVGRIDRGQRANLTILSGPFGNEDSVVRHMFIDGKRFDTGLQPKEEKEKAEEEDEPEEDTEEKEEEAPKEPADNHKWASETVEDRIPSITTSGDVLLRNANVLTGTGETILGGDVLIRNGRISEVGANLSARDTKEIDLTGYWVMPGIIDPHSHLAITGGFNEWSASVTCEVRIADVLTLDQPEMYRALAGGVTTLHAMHGSANVIGGQTAVIKLKYRHSPSEALIASGPGIVKFALGENVTQANFSQRGGRYPVTRMGVETVVRTAFNDALAYQEQMREYKRGRLKVAPRPDIRLQALSDILNGEIWIHSHCYRADEILRLMAAAEDYGVRVATLQHVLEGYRILPEIARHGAAGSTFSDWWAYKIEAADAVPYNAAMMLQEGIVSSINSDDPGVIRHLYLEASKSIRFGGLSADEALRLITINPAIQLGIDDRVGTLEKGKDGDVAVFTHHPLDIRTRCVLTLIEGEPFFQDPQFVAGAGPASTYVPEPPRGLIEIPQGSEAYAIVGATVHTISGDVIESGTVLIEDNTITAVGKDLSIPQGATQVDATGLYVYPGLINAASTLGLVELPRIYGTNDTSELAYFQPDVHAASAVNPHSVHLPVTRAEGITTSVAVPTGGAISGQAGLIDLDGWTMPELLRMDGVGLVVDLPILPTEIDKDRDKRIKEHQEKIFEIEEYIREAQRFAKSNATAAEGAIDDLRLAAMTPYVRGEKPVMFIADSYKQILQALQFADRFNMKAIITGGREAWKAAEALKNAGASVVLTDVFGYPVHEFEPFDGAFACAAKLNAAGVPFAFGYADGTMAKLLPVQAGKSVAHGLPEDAAVRALTLGAAEIIGVSDSIGSIEAGKVADLIITTGSPIQPSTRTVASFIGGTAVSLDSQHETDYHRFNNRPTPKLPPARTDLSGPEPMHAAH